MGIETPGMLNGGTVLTGPSTKGTAGQPLIGDGEGNVEFGDVAAFNPASLGGPITLLKFDEGSGRVARNAFSNTPIAATNLFPYPEQLFAVFGIANGVTVTPLAGNNPNGIATATRLQFSSGVSYLQFTNLGLPSAQYTISLYAKANAGSNVTLRLGTSNFTYSSGLSVPNASGWVRISFTIAEALSGIYIMNDGTNAADVLIWGAMINTGATAAAYPTQDMSALISGTSAPAWSSAGLEFTGDHYAACIQNQPTTFTALTDYVVFRQSDLVQYGAIAHKAGDATKYISPSPGFTDNDDGGKLARIGGTTLQQRSKCDDGKVHVLARRWDGTTMDLMLDGTLIGSVSASTGFTGGAFILGNIPGNANFGFRGTLFAFAMYSASHSTDDMRDMSDWLMELANARGGNARRLEAIVVGEGDSIIADSSGSFFDYGVNALFPAPHSVNRAIGGSTYATLTARLAATTSVMMPAKEGVAIVACGINDLTILGQSAATVAANEEACIQLLIKAGIKKILLCTTLPSTRTDANTKRATLNALRKANTFYGEHGTYFVKISDIGADATYGQDADASDTLKYSDGTHPTQATQLGLAPTITADLETLLSYEVSGGGAPSGAAGGDLTGTYPNPTIGTGKVTSAHIADGTIVNGDISASAAIALSKLATDPLARANHTGTQAASTISDFSTAALTAAPAETTTTVGTLISGATGKTTPVDGDSVGLSDSAASNVLKKLTWANIKATLKTYFDTLYQVLSANLTAFAGLSLIADRLPYANGTGTLALTTFTSAGRALVDDADAAAQRVTMGVSKVGTTSKWDGAVSDATYDLYDASFSHTLSSGSIVCESGTATVTLKIGSTNITGGASISVSSTPTSLTLTAANSVAEDDVVRAVVASGSSLIGLKIVLKGTR